MSEKTVYDYMDWRRIEAIVYGEEASPRDALAPRITPDGVLIQGFFPNAASVTVKAGRKDYAMEKEDEAGFFAALLPLRKLPSYTFTVTFADGTQEEYEDAYAFGCGITDDEEKAFLSGTWVRAYEKLGAHPMTRNGVPGTYFAVWAPNALRVSVVGDFNHWDGRRLPMHRMPASGIFELFVPRVGAGQLYKYEILMKGKVLALKSDPYANMTEKAPGDASEVADLRDFAWTDEGYLSGRKAAAGPGKPMSIFETSLTEWKNGEELLSFLADTGYTHVEFHPVMEYLEEETDGYSTTAYFAPTRRYGIPLDFQKTVDLLHSQDIGVILDWTPAQFPKNAAGLGSFDGTPLYEVQDPAFATHPMWGTYLYNYQSPMVQEFLLGNAEFWARVYHVDGLRLDDVDAMLYLDYGRGDGPARRNIYGGNDNLEAVSFIRRLNDYMHEEFPGFLTIAQEDGLWPETTGSTKEDGLGFDYKWSGGFTHDLVTYFRQDPIMRSGYHDALTLSMLYSYSEHFILTLGLRDVGSTSSFRDLVWGNGEDSWTGVRAACAYMFAHPGCKMTAPDRNVPEGMRTFIRDLNKLYREKSALHEMDEDYDGFEWIQLMQNEQNVLVFLRKTRVPEDTLLVVCNFAAIPYEGYTVGVPFYGRYREVFNSQDEAYGGSVKLPARGKLCRRTPFDERDFSLKLDLAPQSVAIFTCTPAALPKEKSEAEEEETKAVSQRKRKKEN